MNLIEQAAEDLRVVLRTVPNLRVPPDVGPGVDPPAAIVGVPALEWESMCTAPTSARFLVYVVELVGDRAASKLFEWVLAVSAAIDEQTDATVIRADPGVYPSSGGDLPAYQIQVDMPLGG